MYYNFILLILSPSKIRLKIIMFCFFKIFLKIYKKLQFLISPWNFKTPRKNIYYHNHLNTKDDDKFKFISIKQPLNNQKQTSLFPNKVLKHSLYSLPICLDNLREESIYFFQNKLLVCLKNQKYNFFFKSYTFVFKILQINKLQTIFSDVFFFRLKTTIQLI